MEDKGSKLDASNPSIQDPPPYAPPPQSFTVGGRTTSPVVTIAMLKGHLALLHAIAELRKTIEDLVEDPVYPFPMDKSMRWTWFVAFAVERFSVWCESFTIGKTFQFYGPGDSMPPLDVLMVWHTYMLNPAWYAEDCERVPKLRILAELGENFARLLPCTLQTIITLPPTELRVSLWEQQTGRPFDPLEDAEQNVFKKIHCPACRFGTNHLYMDSDGSGYLQHRFKTRCLNQSCRRVIDHSTLAARKLAEDLATPYESTSPNVRLYLAGTLRTVDTAVDNARGKTIKDIFLTAPTIKPADSLPKKEWVDFILQENSYDLSKIRHNMAEQMKQGGVRLLDRIMSAYTNGDMFSVELVGAVLRQGLFIQKMDAMRWTEPGFFDDPLDEVALHHCIARYHAFLDLMSSSPASFFVPTLDIDLAWHTHQLLGKQYNIDCLKLARRYVDHDDKVEEDKLSTAFDTTCRAWRNRFHVQYTHCGCPTPGTTIGQRLFHFKALSGSSARNELVPTTSTGLTATHASDHNSVYDSCKKDLSDFRRQRRNLKRQHRFEREQKKAKAKNDQRSSDEAIVHDPAFLLPIPIWYYTPVGIGCVAYAESVVDTSRGTGSSFVSACSSGAGACSTNSACGGGSACGSCGSGGGCGGGGCGGGCGG